MIGLNCRPEELSGKVRQATRVLLSLSNDGMPVEAEAPSVKKPWYKKWWIWVVAILVVGGGAALAASSGGDGNGGGDKSDDTDYGSIEVTW